MVPSAGRIVAYTLSASDAEQINRRRIDAGGSIARNDGASNTGFVLHTGNTAREGDVFPLLITKVFNPAEGGAVNGQVLLDGNDSLWVTSRVEGEGSSCWRPFPRV